MTLTRSEYQATMDLAAAEARQGLGPRRRVRRRPPPELRRAWDAMKSTTLSQPKTGTEEAPNDRTTRI